MHEFKHGELKSGPGGKGGKVKSRKQAIAIALKEAGASNRQSKAENRRSLAKTKRKEARGQTAQQRREGKAHVGARDRRKTAASGRSAARGRTLTKAELYARAKKRNIPGRSRMSKGELEAALR